MIFDAVHWTKVFKRIAYLIFAILGIYIFFELSVFYMPFLVAFIISLIIEPVIKFFMDKFNLNRKTSAIIIFIVLFGIFLGITVWGIITLVSETNTLLMVINDYFDKTYVQVQKVINNFDFDKINFSQEFSNILKDSVSEMFIYLANWIKSFLTNLINVITSIPKITIYFVITILSLYFICTDKIYILDQAEHHLPRKWANKITNHIREIIKTLGGYLKAQAILIILSFVISVIGLYIYKFMGLNIEYPLLIALAIAFVDSLPILGSGTVMVPWGIGGLLNGDISLGLAIIGLWLFMSIVRQLIEPKVVGKQIGIHPIFTLIAMYTGFKFWGIIGLVIGPILLIILNNIFSTLIDKGIVKTIFD